MEPTTTPTARKGREGGLVAFSTFTFTYRVASGALQSFRCVAGSNEAAVALFSQERSIVRAVTGGSVAPLSVEVER